MDLERKFSLCSRQAGRGDHWKEAAAQPEMPYVDEQLEETRKPALAATPGSLPPGRSSWTGFPLRPPRERAPVTGIG